MRGGLYNTIRLSYLEGLPLLHLVASQFCSERMQGCEDVRMQGLLYACTSCCYSGVVVPTECYGVALFWGRRAFCAQLPRPPHARFARPGGFLRNLIIHKFNCPFCCPAMPIPTIFLPIIRSFSANQTSNQINS